MGDVSKRKDFNRRIERKVPGEWWARCTPPRRPIPLTSFVAFRTFCLSRIPSKTTWQQRKGTGSGRLLYSLCQNEDLFLDPLVYRLDWQGGALQNAVTWGRTIKERKRKADTIPQRPSSGGSRLGDPSHSRAGAPTYSRGARGGKASLQAHLRSASLHLRGDIPEGRFSGHYFLWRNCCAWPLGELKK